MSMTYNHINNPKINSEFQNANPSVNYAGTNGIHSANTNPNIFIQFFLLLSRANTDILKQCPSSDWNKYIVLGIILFLMSIYNVFSFNHFFNECGISVWSSLIFSVLLSLLILFIDQAFIVSSIYNPSDGLLKKFFNSFLRLLFSLSISYLISIPVKIMIFDDAIQKAYNMEKARIADSLRNHKFTTPENENFCAVLENKLQNLSNQISEKTNRLDFLNKSLEHPSCRYYYYDEYGNKKYGYTVKGKNIIAEIEQTKMDRNMLSMDMEKVKQSLDSMNHLLTTQTQINRKFSDSLLNAHALNFSMKYRYFNKITEFDKKFPFIQSDYAFFCLILNIFLCFIDFMPVFIKVFIFNGTYELIQYKNYITAKQNTEHELRMLAENKKQEINTLMSDINHRNALENMKKEHEKELLKIRISYEKALELMQYKDNLNEAIYHLNDISKKLKELYDEQTVTVSSPVMSNIQNKKI